jgi:uncharacterized protein (TIGR02285 family)
MNNKKMCLLIAGMLAAGTAAAQEITVSWRENPPYNYTEQGVEKGFLLARGKQIFAQAHVPAKFVVEPTKRIWAKFRVGTPAYCSLGRYRLPEREPVMQYSLPIHVDPPRIVLLSAAAARQAHKYSKVTELLADSSLSLGMSDGGSFGTDIDGMLKSAATQVERRTVESPLMMKLLAADRISFVFADRYAWHYLKQHDPAAKDIVAREFPDMPAGQKRYLVCSNDISPDVMHRLNAAIKSMKITSQPLSDAELNQ